MKDGFDVASAVQDADDFNAVLGRPIEDQNIADRKAAKSGEQVFYRLADGWIFAEEGRLAGDFADDLGGGVGVDFSNVAVDLLEVESRLRSIQNNGHLVSR